MKKVLLAVSAMLVMALQSFADKTGTCGAKISWTFNESTGALTLTGSGDMTDYEWGESPFCFEAIKTINISNGITSIGNLAFNGCTELKTVTLPTSLTWIGEQAFNACSSLTSITIPKSVKHIDPSSFSYSANLSSIVVESGNSVYDSRNNCNAIIETKTNKLITGCRKTTIPSTVTSIGYGAFEGCEGLTSISFPSSLKTIEDYAFYSCENLTSITIPKSVTSIGKGAFFSCQSITSMKVETGNSVYDSRNNCNAIIETKTNTLLSGCGKTVIPNGVTTIATEAFAYCSSLSSITIPASVKTIEDYAFEMCEGLTSVSIPKATSYISDLAFTYCSGLTAINVEAGNPIYDSRNNCNALILTSENKIIRGCAQTIIPNTITSIGSDAFNMCTDLTSITIPSSVTSIGASAFYDCYNLESIYAMSPTPISLGEDAFGGVPTDFCILYVPHSPFNTVSLYRNAAGWNEFKNIRMFDPDNPDAPNADVNHDGNINSADVVSVYNYIINAEGSLEDADVNKDHTVNAADAVAIYNIIAGK